MYLKGKVMVKVFNTCTIVEENYSVYMSQFDNPRVVLLPEHGGKEHQRLRNGAVINALYQPGDIVLYQDRTIQGRKEGQIRYVATHIEANEWGIKKIKKDTVVLEEQITTFYYLISDIFNSSPKSTRFKEKVSEFRSFCKIKEFSAQFLTKQLEPDLREICKEKKIKKVGTESLFDIYIRSCCIYKCFRQLPLLEVDRTITKQNESLVKAIHDNLTENNRIFVIADKEHLIARKAVTDEEIKALCTLKDGLKGKEFVILKHKKVSPKNSLAGLKRTYNKLEYGLFGYYARMLIKPFKSIAQRISSLCKGRFSKPERPSHIQFKDLVPLYDGLFSTLEKRDIPTAPLSL
jgi:hypothetical protein